MESNYSCKSAILVYASSICVCEATETDLILKHTLVPVCWTQLVVVTV